MKQIKKIVLVGRMNVGKSTLFNLLTGSEKAIISSMPGTTRDANSGTVLWRGAELEILDTGGLDVKEDEQLEERVIAMAKKSMMDADAILFVIDGTAGVLPHDKMLAKEIRSTGIPALLVMNKIDNVVQESQVTKEVHKLGITPMVSVSARNGRGSGDLLDEVYNLLKPETDAAERAKIRRTHVAIVGRPNVGKSSLLNAIMGEERVIVADKEHTTRDTNDIPFEYKGRPYMLIDTAGIRKQKNVGSNWPDKRMGDIERKSVYEAMRAIERADVVLLVLEAQKRITLQDKKIAQIAEERGKGLILVLNKWDLIEEKDSTTINEFIKYFTSALPFLKWVPMIFISAQDNVRVRNTLDLVDQVAQNFRRDITEEQLKDILYITRSHYKPKYQAIRKWRKPQLIFKSLVQTSVAPPRFYLKVNKPKDVPTALPKIIEREMRDRFDLEGVNIILEVGK